jgi:hypothetical protein
MLDTGKVARNASASLYGIVYYGLTTRLRNFLHFPLSKILVVAPDTQHREKIASPDGIRFSDRKKQIFTCHAGRT